MKKKHIATLQKTGSRKNARSYQTSGGRRRAGRRSAIMKKPARNDTACTAAKMPSDARRPSVESIWRYASDASAQPAPRAPGRVSGV